MGKLRSLTRQIRERQRQAAQTKKQTENGEKPVFFWSLFADQKVEVKLITGETLFGRLIWHPYNKYDVLLETENGRLLLPKHSVLYMRVVEETD